MTGRPANFYRTHPKYFEMFTKVLLVVLVGVVAAAYAVPAKEIRPIDSASEGSEICNGLQEGDSCTKDDCEQCGYCEDLLSYYYRCVRTFPSDPKDPITGVIQRLECDNDLWWNPDQRPANSTVGGSCDKWDNLSPAVQGSYKGDPKCVPVDPLCEWGQDEADKCSERYWYLDPKKSDERQNLTCKSGLIWDPSTETCRDSSNVDGCH